MDKKVSVIICGCGTNGSRGTAYSDEIAKIPDRAEVVAVADPREICRNTVGDKHNVPADRRFKSWEDVAKLPKFADAVLVCTQDNMHEEPVIAFAKLGYNILCEKPMAPTADACRRMVAAVKEAGVIFAVCHVLRYTPYTKKLKEVLDTGVLGKIISIQHLEPVAHWHQAHSYVRGNWRNEKEASFMLLAKCCHDVDWIRYIMDRPCKRIQSFGSLQFFKKECQPEGAADRCTDCPEEIEKNCPYSALKIYVRDGVDKGGTGWPSSILTPVVTRENVMKALKEGPYGRCVFACDNDVVDNQVVNMEFADGCTASMTMTAFCNEGGRQTRIFGTRGSICTNSTIIKVTDFLTGKVTEIDTNVANDGNITSGHGGGDTGIIDGFIKALATNDRKYILSGTDVTLESHIMTFAAEESRKTGKIVDIKL